MRYDPLSFQQYVSPVPVSFIVINEPEPRNRRMAAHQITINPLSGGIGTAPAGIVPYASDMWGVNAVRVPQVGTPSSKAQAKAITVGTARRAATGDVSISLTSKLSPPAIIRASQWGTATLSFSSAVEAESCYSEPRCWRAAGMLASQAWRISRH